MHIDDEVNARIAKASAAFGRLRGSVWDQSGIRLDTKLKVFKAVVLPKHNHAKRGQFTNGTAVVLPTHMHAKRGQFTNGTPKD